MKNKTACDVATGTEIITASPFQGYYVAAYAVPTVDGYLAFAKICSTEPNDVWQCKAVSKVAGAPASDQATALESVFKKAGRAIVRLRHFPNRAWATKS